MADDDVEGQPAGLEDDAYDPANAPRSSKAWLTMISDAEKVFNDYQDRADNIDKLYANLEKLASLTRDRQFQLFWANVGVVGPSSYARPPVPVVVPRFKDRKALPRAASELLERSTIVVFEQEDIDFVMRSIRDDVNVLARGCAWVRYEAAEKGENYLSERVCIEHTDRRDFLHEPARVWKDVDWVAKASFLVKKDMRKRFYKTSGKAYQDAGYEKRKDGKEFDDGRLKAKVWELWCKSENKVVWVTEGVDVVLDEGEPHLTLEGFFPCPRPAYATTQRGTLIPVPDMMFYKDQLEEINELTARIGALTDALKVRGFYQAGAGEIGDAVETAMKATANNAILVPLANAASMGGQAFKDAIMWLPIDMIAATIKELVELRKQLIDDVYQITGLSDIMRGSTVASETLGAQELKSQYGSVRIRDRQSELVRFARDLTRITAEVMAENFQQKTLLEMSQLEIKFDADIAIQIQTLQQQGQTIQMQMQQAQQDPRLQQMAQQNPQQAQQLVQQAQGQLKQLQQQIGQLQQTVTIEKVIAFLRDQRLRPFVLDIETDSTIAPDENATKQRATEFITAVGAFMGQAVPLVQAVPESAQLMAESLKFVASQYRAGRELEGAIEEFADQMKQVATKPKPPSPEQIKADSEAKALQTKTQTEAQAAEADAAEKHANAQKTVTESQSKAAMDEFNQRKAEQEAMDAADERRQTLASKQQLTDQQMMQAAEKHAQEMEKGELELELLEAKIEQANTQTSNVLDLNDAKIEGAEAKASEVNDAPKSDAPRKPRTKRRSLRSEVADGHTQTAEMMTKALATLGEQNHAIVAALTAPKIIIKDQQGSPVGVRIASN